MFQVELAGVNVAQRTAPIVWSCNRLQTLAQFDYLQVGRTSDARHRRYPDLVQQLPDSVMATDIAMIIRDTTATDGRNIASPNTLFSVIYDLSGVIWVSVTGGPASRQCLYAFDQRGNRLRDRDIEAVA